MHFRTTESLDESMFDASNTHLFQELADCNWTDQSVILEASEQDVAIMISHYFIYTNV